MVSPAPPFDWFDALLAALARALPARRSLVLGVRRLDACVAIACAMPSAGLLIAIEADAGAAGAARTALGSPALPVTASVIAGEPSRYLHKVAGPFDLVVYDGDPERYGALHERLVSLLGQRGALVIRRTAHTADYNTRLAADARLHTTVFPAGDGMAISVKRQDP